MRPKRERKERKGKKKGGKERKRERKEKKKKERKGRKRCPGSIFINLHLICKKKKTYWQKCLNSQKFSDLYTIYYIIDDRHYKGSCRCFEFICTCPSSSLRDLMKFTDFNVLNINL